MDVPFPCLDRNAGCEARVLVSNGQLNDENSTEDRERIVCKAVTLTRYQRRYHWEEVLLMEMVDQTQIDRGYNAKRLTVYVDVDLVAVLEEGGIDRNVMQRGE